MIDEPGIELTAEPAPEWAAEGPLSARVLQVAERVAPRLATREGADVPRARFRVVRAPREHMGLGVGTQLSLAVVRLLEALAGRPEPPLDRLAGLAERGLRSGIGLHGFAHGGLLVDGGHRGSGRIPPLVGRVAFPSDWSILVVLPEVAPGCHGPEEVRAFAQLPPIPERVTERLCRLVLLGLLPAAADRDLPAFGTGLTELQQQVGRCFAPAQGGTFAHPEIEAIVSFLQAEGLHGVGQSSWGPAVYGFTDQPDEPRARILRRLQDRFGPLAGAAFWTTANNDGMRLADLSCGD
jgi:beta-RFAP synthase